jgi:hypothetical protein
MLHRVHLLGLYLWKKWGRDECFYSLDQEDVRLLHCLKGVYSVGGGIFNAILKDRSRLSDFVDAKKRDLAKQMEKIFDAFCERFVTRWDDPTTITIQIAPGACYSLMYELSVEKSVPLWIRPWIVYQVKSDTKVLGTFKSIERMVGFFCARVKRLELCCLFQDMNKLHRFPAHRTLQPAGIDDVPGPEQRSDEFQAEGPADEPDLSVAGGPGDTDFPEAGGPGGPTFQMDGSIRRRPGAGPSL